MTKKNRSMLSSYNHATARTIWDAYTRPSNAKENAYRAIRQQMEDVDGYDLRICGASNHFFSAAYRYVDAGREMLRYITKSHEYTFPVNGEEA